jgi:hypothetical protein
MRVCRIFCNIIFLNRVVSIFINSNLFFLSFFIKIVLKIVHRDFLIFRVQLNVIWNMFCSRDPQNHVLYDHHFELVVGVVNKPKWFFFQFGTRLLLYRKISSDLGITKLFSIPKIIVSINLTFEMNTISLKAEDNWLPFLSW